MTEGVTHTRMQSWALGSNHFCVLMEIENRFVWGSAGFREAQHPVHA